MFSHCRSKKDNNIWNDEALKETYKRPRVNNVTAECFTCQMRIPCKDLMMQIFEDTTACKEKCRQQYLFLVLSYGHLLDCLTYWRAFSVSCWFVRAHFAITLQNWCPLKTLISLQSSHNSTCSLAYAAKWPVMVSPCSHLKLVLFQNKHRISKMSCAS